MSSSAVPTHTSAGALPTIGGPWIHSGLIQALWSPNQTIESLPPDEWEKRTWPTILKASKQFQEYQQHHPDNNLLLPTAVVTNLPSDVQWIHSILHLVDEWQMKLIHFLAIGPYYHLQYEWLWLSLCGASGEEEPNDTLFVKRALKDFTRYAIRYAQFLQLLLTLGANPNEPASPSVSREFYSHQSESYRLTGLEDHTPLMLAISKSWLPGVLVLIRHSLTTNTRLDGLSSPSDFATSSQTNQTNVIDAVFRYRLHHLLAYADAVALGGEMPWRNHVFTDDEVDREILKLESNQPFVSISDVPNIAFQSSIDSGVGSIAYPSPFMVSLLRQLPNAALADMTPHRNELLQTALHLIHGEWMIRICSELVWVMGNSFFLPLPPIASSNLASVLSSTSSTSPILDHSLSASYLAVEAIQPESYAHESTERTARPIIQPQINQAITKLLTATQTTQTNSNQSHRTHALRGLSLDQAILFELSQRRKLLPEVLLANPTILPHPSLAQQPWRPQYLGIQHGLFRRIARTNYLVHILCGRVGMKVKSSTSSTSTANLSRPSLSLPIDIVRYCIATFL